MKIQHGSEELRQVTKSVTASFPANTSIVRDILESASIREIFPRSPRSLGIVAGPPHTPDQLENEANYPFDGDEGAR